MGQTKTASIAGGRVIRGGDGRNRTADLWVMNPYLSVFIDLDRHGRFTRIET